jgi:mono/diheme cytochrome c family protein
MKRRTLGFLALGAAIVGAALVGAGAYDVSSTDQHLAPTYRLLDFAMRRSVVVRARFVDVPPLDDAARRERGLRHYDRHCVTCHGAPGIAPDAFAFALTPAPANLVHTAATWRPEELYWVAREGLKMTGMPAWEGRLADDELWDVVAFLRELPALTPAEYRARTGRRAPVAADVPVPPGAADGDAQRGRQAIHRYGCSTCHAIPGIVGANAPVGPPLAGYARRTVIAGRLPHTPANLVRWLQAPQRIKPASAMPDLGLDDRDAADVAAYLRTLH